MAFLDICLFSICGITEAEITFYYCMDRINQISWYDYRIIFPIQCHTKCPAHNDLHPSLLLPYCSAHRLLDWLYIVFSFLQFYFFSKGLSNVTIRACNERGATWAGVWPFSVNAEEITYKRLFLLHKTWRAWQKSHKLRHIFFLITNADIAVKRNWLFIYC